MRGREKVEEREGGGKRGKGEEGRGRLNITTLWTMHTYSQVHGTHHIP